MPAFVIFDVTVQDAATYEAYRQAGSPSVAKYGGSYVVRGGKVKQLEGDWQPKRVIVIEFESFDQADRWYNSPEYQAALPDRLRSAVSKVIIVDGV